MQLVKMSEKLSVKKASFLSKVIKKVLLLRSFPKKPPLPIFEKRERERRRRRDERRTGRNSREATE